MMCQRHVQGFLVLVCFVFLEEGGKKDCACKDFATRPFSHPTTGRAVLQLVCLECTSSHQQFTSCQCFFIHMGYYCNTVLQRLREVQYHEIDYNQSTLGFHLVGGANNIDVSLIEFSGPYCPNY